MNKIGFGFLRLPTHTWTSVEPEALPNNADEETRRLQFFENVKPRCLRQRAPSLIIMVITGRKEAIANA